MTLINKLLFFIFLLVIYLNNSYANNIWIIDKKLSEIKFEVPVLMLENVKGSFNNFEGYIIIDFENIENNKALFSVQVDSMELNYNKHKNLLLSDVFFDTIKYPIAILDTKKFINDGSENQIEIHAELNIKNISESIPLLIKINKYSNDILQIKTNFYFSRGKYELGKGSWASTMILKDKIKIFVDLFLNRK